MEKECPYCSKKFKAPPSGRKYCSYEHFVYDHWADNEEASLIIWKYKAHSIPKVVWDELREGAKKRRAKK